MRTIKFRGRHLCGEWLYGSLIHLNDGKNDVYLIQDEDGSSEDVEEDTIGQFTGLSDCVGNEIYEGDIIKHETADFFGEILWHKNGYFYIKDSSSEGDHTPLGKMLESEDFRVIGNIHDNDKNN